MQNKQPELRQSFGFWTGWFLVVACMVGSGILTTSGPIVKSTGNYGVLLLLWIIGGVIALSGALSLGELASGMPKVGGDYAFVFEAFGPVYGFVYGWAMVLLGFAAPVALIAHTTALYLQPALVGTIGGTFVGSSLFLTVVASVLIVIFTLLHCLGQEESSRVQGATTIFKILVLVGFVVLAFFSRNSQWQNLVVKRQGATASIPELASSLILIMYAYTGWNAAAYLSGEIKKSATIVPRCLTYGTIAVTSLYLLVNVAYGLALSPDQITALSVDELSRIADSAANMLMGAAMGRTFSFLVSLGVVASLSAYILTGPRVIFAMAHDGNFPLLLGKLDTKRSVPVIATLFQGVLSLLLLWSGTFSQLLDFTGYGLAFLSMLVVAPLFKMRKRADFSPPFRVPFYPWTPALFLGLNLLMLIGGAINNIGLALLSISSVSVGFPIYYGWRAWKQRSKKSF